MAGLDQWKEKSNRLGVRLNQISKVSAAHNEKGGGTRSLAHSLSLSDKKKHSLLERALLKIEKRPKVKNNDELQYNYCYYCYSQGINVFFSFYLTLFSIGEMQPVRFESTAPPPPLPTDTIAQIGREGGGRRERRGRAIVSTREGNKIQPRGERREKSSSQTDKGKHGCNGKTLFKTSTCTGEDALVVLHIVGGNSRTLPPRF